MFFELGKVVLKILQYSQESTCAGVSFVGLKVFNTLQYRCFLVFFWCLHLTVLLQYSKVSWVACSLILRLHVLFILIKNFHVAQIILYYHVTKQFLPCLNWLVTCFWFQNMFWKNINCFRLWWKIYLKRCTSNYVISQAKGFSSAGLGGWSGAFDFKVDVLCE